MSDVARRGDCQDAAAIRAGHGGHFGRGQGKIKRNGGMLGAVPPTSTLPGFPRHPSALRQFTKLSVEVASAIGNGIPSTVPWVRVWL